MPHLRPVFILAALCLILACAAISPAPAPALPQGVEVKFPTSITFTMPDPPAGVTDARVIYNVARRSCARFAATGYADTPGKTPTWTWDLQRAGGLPPGSRLTFHWETADASGAVQSTADQEFIVEDARYQWRSLTQGPVTVRWHAGNDAFAKQLLDSATKSAERLAQETGGALQSATIYVYQSVNELRGALVNPQEWTGGQAFPESGIIVIAVPPGAVSIGTSYIAHELSHLFVGEVTSNCYTRAPSWLDEGLAVHIQGDTGGVFAASLARAVAKDDLFTVRALRGEFPTSSEEATLAYAESVSFVQYLLDQHGAQKMAALLDSFRQGMTDDAALSRAYGCDQEGLYAQWRAYKGLPALPSPAMPSPTVTPSPTATPLGLDYIRAMSAASTVAQPAATPVLLSQATALPIATKAVPEEQTTPVATIPEPLPKSTGCAPLLVGDLGAPVFEMPLALGMALGVILWKRRRQ